MSLLLACSLMCLMGSASAFFPYRYNNMNIGGRSFTQQDITEFGMLWAVAAYFEDNPSPGFEIGDITEMEDITTRRLLRRYYNAEVTGTSLQRVIDTVVRANNLVSQTRSNEAIWSFNGELIKEANEMMIALREEILLVLDEDSPDYNLARGLTGEFLHTLQMFYSNTNWVEMFGNDPYIVLGIPGEPLMAQALPETRTCESCGPLVSSPRSCDNNLLIDNILTSGYRSEQDMIKPTRDPEIFTTGKCSHGGLFDMSANTEAALGGINKDSVRSVLSPHNDRHRDAAIAAIKHTIYFFNNPENGLRFMIGDSKYRRFLQFGPGPSLTFVIDDTGSMRNDIEAVREVVTTVIGETAGTINEPFIYNFVFANDPKDLNYLFQTTDSAEALEYINNKDVSGGGDCEEYLLNGLLKGLGVAEAYSDIYIFTDAPPKDEELLPDVLSIAEEKSVRLTFFVTDGCSRKRRQTEEKQGYSGPPSVRRKRETHKEGFYRVLATATGGSMYSTTKAGITKLASVITETFLASVTILKRTILPGEVSDINIPVDNTVRQLIVKLTGSGSFPEQIYNPSGAIQTTDVNVTDISIGVLMKIGDPEPGVWRLSGLDSNFSTTVEVTAQSVLDITPTFVQMDETTGFEYEIIGRPVAGEIATVVMFVPDNDLVNTLDLVQLVDSSGAELSRYTDITLVESLSNTRLYRTDFTLPSKEFHVVVSGDDTTGNRYTRHHSKNIAPVDIQLYLLPTNEKLYVNETLDLNFLVVNKGDAASDITVTIADDQELAQPPLQHKYTLEPEARASGQFILQAKANISSAAVTTVTLSANTNSTGDSPYSQFVVKRISTQMRVTKAVDNTAPTCDITSITGSCDIEKLDPCTCSQHTWSGSAVISDEGFGLYQISSSVKTGGSFSYDPFLPGHTIDNGTIKATFTSDCCNPLIYVTVVDMGSNTGQCVFDQAPGLEVIFPECSTPESLPLAVIGGVAGAGAVVVVAVLVAVVYVVKKGKRSKVGTSKEDLVFAARDKHYT